MFGWIIKFCFDGLIMTVAVVLSALATLLMGV